jgi:hypothetical protein
MMFLEVKNSITFDRGKADVLTQVVELDVLPELFRREKSPSCDSRLHVEQHHRVYTSRDTEWPENLLVAIAAKPLGVP